MATYAWPFDSNVTLDGSNNPVYDRAISSDTLSAILRRFFSDGVFMSSVDALQVTSVSGMTLSIAPGNAHIQGKCWGTDAAISITIEAANSQPRYDRIILRRDNNSSVRNIYPLVIKGTPATSPSVPAQTRTSLIYDITLAYVYVGANVTSISQGNITDKRNSTECGAVVSINADINNTLAGNQAIFDAWLASIQGILSGDVAGNLLTLINQRVSYSASDGKTTTEKTQARTNIDAQKTLNSGNPLSTTAGGLGASYTNLGAIATAIANQQGLKSLAYLHLQAGYASITIPAGQTTASLTVTYNDAFSAAPIDADCKLYGTGFPNAYGGKFASLHSSSPTATQITLAVGIGTAQASDVSIPVRWSAIGTHS